MWVILKLKVNRAEFNDTLVGDELKLSLSYIKQNTENTSRWWVNIKFNRNVDINNVVLE
jgi:hypothetical protein